MAKEFYPVIFRAFTNTTCNQLWVEHNYNAAHHEQRQRMPAVMVVRKDEHKQLLSSLAPGTKIEISCGWDPEIAGDGLFDLKV